LNDSLTSLTLNNNFNRQLTLNDTLTSLTIGYLQDIKFTVNEKSEWIKDDGKTMLWATTETNLLLPSNTTKKNQQFLRYPCNHNK
jgi:hypothetical protein